MVEAGAKNSNQVVILERLLDSNPLVPHGQHRHRLRFGHPRPGKDGPTVVEIPPGVGPGTVNDAFFRFVVDMGAPGPDKGKGGKYLILPPDYKGRVPSGYFAAQSRSYVNWLILRGFLVDGRPDAAANQFKDS